MLIYTPSSRGAEGSMATYEYKMVQIPPTIAVKKEAGTEAADFLQRLATEQAADGWEYYRVDQLGVASNPGCLSGQRAGVAHYYVVVFRRERITE